MERERRLAVRRRILKGARIAVSDDRAAIHCIVRNVSETGACLMVESPLAIPDSFRLVFDTLDVERDCRAVWRSADRMGVQFR